MSSEMSYYEIFQKQLAKVREMKGLSQSDLARKCGLPASSISHLERGARRPSFDNLIRISMILDVSLDYLIKGNMKNMISKEQILDKIKKRTFTRLPSGKVTICELTLENGFTVIGKAAVVDIANFDQKIGESIAYENAVDQIWQIEGYLLQEKLFRDNHENQMQSRRIESKILKTNC